MGPKAKFEICLIYTLYSLKVIFYSSLSIQYLITTDYKMLGANFSFMASYQHLKG